MALSKASILALVALLIAFIGAAAAQAVDAPAPSPTSGAGSISLFFGSSGLVALMALVFGAGFSNEIHDSAVVDLILYGISAPEKHILH
ncbi:hypothetical protein HS088_TW09G01273 [Tripterygium wilfordii]|uniref:Uncharacterized protein n=1 Tax=Tripterygium wilfordii TaxID=458696 RepID=A0A7J7DAC7_TRIWF|nr:hypothetical protein HS088_TW09G01273 [Tripterygium wilfordii]